MNIGKEEKAWVDLAVRNNGIQEDGKGASGAVWGNGNIWVW